MRGDAVPRPYFGRGRGRQTGIVAGLAEAIKMARGLDINLAVIWRGCAEAAAIQRNMGDDVAVLVTGLDDVKRALGAGFAGAFGLRGGVVEHGDVELAIGKDGAGVALFNADFEFP